MELRNSVEASLSGQDIQTRRWWPEPLSSMPAFTEFSSDMLFPISGRVSDTILGLPMYRGITIKELANVRKAIEDGMSGR